MARDIKPTDISEVLADTSNVVTILNGQTDSNAIDCGGATLLGFTMPAAWTSADIKFKTSNDGITFVDHNIGSSTSVPLQISVAANNSYALQQAVYLAGWKYLKIVSTVAQGADRVITLSLRGL